MSTARVWRIPYAHYLQRTCAGNCVTDTDRLQSRKLSQRSSTSTSKVDAVHTKGGLSLSDRNEDLYVPSSPYRPGTPDARSALDQLPAQEREYTEPRADIDASLPTLPPVLARNSNVYQKSRQSSPLTDLSSITSTPPSLPTSLTQSSAIRPAQPTSVLGSNEPNEVSDTQLMYSSSHVGPELSSHPTRRFRRRTAVQNNPYTIEGQRYKNTVRSRGLKPVQVDECRTHQGGAETSASDSNDEASVSSGTSSPNPARSTRASERPRTSFRPAAGSRSPFALPSSPSGLNLPGWESPSPERRAASVSNRFKRRKITHTYTASHNGTRNRSEFVHDGDRNNGPKPQVEFLGHNQTGTYRIVSSPPPSSPAPLSAGPQEDTGIPPSRRTPTSNDKIPLGENSAQDCTRLPVAIDSDCPDESSPKIEQDLSIRKAQRRIKGVLPASWLRLDLTKQHFDSAKTGVPRAEPARDTERNTITHVAFHRQPSSPNSAFAESPSSPSECPDPNAGGFHPRSSAQAERRRPTGLLSELNTVLHVEDDDSMEDNHIDRMEPPRPRNSTKRKISTRARQTKVTDSMFGFQEERTRGTDSAYKRKVHRVFQVPLHTQKQSSKPTRKKIRDRKLINLLSVANRTSSEKPSLELRIAAREARPDTSHNREHRRAVGLSLFATRGAEATQGRKKRVLGVSQLKQGLLRRQNSRPRTRQALASVSGNRQGQIRGYPNHEACETGLGAISPDSGSLGQDFAAHENDCSDQHAERRKPNPPHIFAALDSRRLVQARLELPRVKGYEPGPSYSAPRHLIERFLGDSQSPQPKFSGSRHTTTKKRAPQKVIPRQIFPVSRSPEPKQAFTRKLHRKQSAGTQGSPYSYLSGLAPYGIEYKCFIQVEPLPDGPFFDSTTLLGSGLLSKCLKTFSPQEKRGRLPVFLDQANRQWGIWDEALSSDFDWIFKQITNILKCTSKDRHESFSASGSIVENLTSMVRYFAEHLSFFDAVDQRTCLSRLHCHLAELVVGIDTVLQVSEEGTATQWIPNAFLIPVLTRSLMLAAQCSRLAANSRIPLGDGTRTDWLLERLVSQTLKAIFRDGFEDFKIISQKSSVFSGRTPRTISRVKAEAFIIALHIVEDATSQDKTVWEHMVSAEALLITAGSTDVGYLETKWDQIFALLPLFDISEKGEVTATRRMTDQRQHWDGVKLLVKPILDTYLGNARQQGPTFNAYIRSVFSRCYVLIEKWAWVKCDSIISMIFDFFAKTNLEHLRNEENSGSPTFLENLSPALHLRIDPSDKSFHVFLKIVGSGFRLMRSAYTKQKLAGLAYRLIPNHDRRLVKHEAVEQKDLEALRNHHDILVVLYWSLPPGARIHVRQIERLVDFTDSHKEACRISAKSWSDLINFQLSAVGEPETNIAPLTAWADEMLTQTIRLHRHARAEVEIHARSTERILQRGFSERSQEVIVTSNQSQLESLIIEVLGFLHRAVPKSSSYKALAAIIPSSLGGVLGLFDLYRPRINDVVHAALDVILQYTERAKALHITLDSQDSIDWSEITGVPLRGLNDEPAVLPESIHQALYRLMSNAFGSDMVVQDLLLMKVIECWVATAHLEIQAGRRSWDVYLGLYGQFSWSALRDTEQRRKFTPYFYAVLVQKVEGIYEQHRLTILKGWLESLVERAALLKFQHKLTMILLNRHIDENLLGNPPFSRATGTGSFAITEVELRDRRQALIACVLSNMRESLRTAAPNDAKQHMVDYGELLKRLMAAMKGNYQSLGQNPGVTDAYVKFVQGVVEVLQHQTADIYPVDQFFTDSKSFPLPVGDPDYVTGKIRNYGLRLGHPGISKTLSSFILSIAQRAALAGSETQLTEQLQDAMVSEPEARHIVPESLLPIMIRDICSAYIDVALDSPCGWVLARPVLMALPIALEALADSIDGTDEPSIDLAETVIISTLWHIKRSLLSVMDRGVSLAACSTFRVFTIYFAILTAALRPLNYIAGLSTNPWPIIALVDDFGAIERHVFSFALSKFSDSIEQHPTTPHELKMDTQPPSRNNFSQGTYSFALGRLQGELKNDWRFEYGSYSAKSGRAWVAVASDLGAIEDECQRFVAQAQGFRKVRGCMPAFTKFHEDYEYDIWKI